MKIKLFEKWKIKRMLRKKAKIFIENTIAYSGNMSVKIRHLFLDFHKSHNYPLSIQEYEEIFRKAFEEVIKDYRVIATTFVRDMRDRGQIVFVNYSYEDFMKTMIVKFYEGYDSEDGILDEDHDS